MTELVRNLELHEAMVLVLLERKFETKQACRTTTELAKEICSRKLYLQKEGGFASASQVGARARQYPALFRRAVVGGKQHIWLKELPRRSQLVARVVAIDS